MPVRRPPFARRSRRSLASAFGMGALVGIPIGMIWSWFDYGAFELGYMSNHVVGAAFFTGLLAVGAEALRRRFSRHEGGDA